MDYFSRREAWSYLTKIFIYPAQYGLPGVFAHNPFPDVINGSLWTLRLEFGLYAVVAGLGALGLIRSKRLTTALILICLAAYVVLTRVANVSVVPRQILDFFANAVPFFVGMALAQTCIDTKRTGTLTLALIVVSVVLFHGPFFQHALLLSLPFAVLFLAHNMQCHLGKFGDYSYGLYLWGFPVEQVLIHFFSPLTITQLFLRAGIVTLVIAVISWHCVEKRALRLKPRRSGT